MIQTTIKIFQEYPEMLVFLALAMGYLVGKIRIKGFGLGTTASVLLAAMALGQISVEVPAILKNISFGLFAFCIGYQVGPQFFGSLRKEGLNYLWIALIVALAGLGTAILLGKALHFDSGTTAGLFAGAMTQSAAIGTAQGAVANLSMPDAAKAALNNNIAVAYAITYIFGTVGVILLFKLIPGFMKLNLKDEAQKLEKNMGQTSDLSKRPELFSWSQQLRLRAYRAVNLQVIGKRVGEVERLFPSRVEINKIKRGDRLFETFTDSVIEKDDALVIMAKGNVSVASASGIIGPEVDFSEVDELVGESLEVCVLNKAIAGKALKELGNIPESRGVFLKKITRQGRELPIVPDTVINKCDMVHIIGTKECVERAAKLIGYIQPPIFVTDMVIVGLGCVLGTLIGMIVVPILGVPLSLSEAGGILVAGLVAGWLRSVHPTFGQISEGGQWILNELGLNLFIACVGLVSAKQAIAALQTNGLAIFLAGIVLAVVPIIAGLIFGKYALRMNPVLLLGALTGARVIPPALNALEEDANSSTLTLGFAAPFAFANVFLTVMGSVIINLM